MSKKGNTPFIKRLSRISTPLISDTMGKCLSRKLKHQTMDCHIKPVDQKFKVCGPAYTVQCYQGATYAMEKAVAEAPAGSDISKSIQMSYANWCSGCMKVTALTAGTTLNLISQTAEMSLGNFHSAVCTIKKRYL